MSELAKDLSKSINRDDQVEVAVQTARLLGFVPERQLDVIEDWARPARAWLLGKAPYDPDKCEFMLVPRVTRDFCIAALATKVDSIRDQIDSTYPHSSRLREPMWTSREELAAISDGRLKLIGNANYLELRAVMAVGSDVNDDGSLDLLHGRGTLYLDPDDPESLDTLVGKFKLEKEYLQAQTDWPRLARFDEYHFAISSMQRALTGRKLQLMQGV